MPKKVIQKHSTEEIKHLEKKLADYQKRYDNLIRQSPERWWHDEHFDIQLRVFETAIAELKKKISELKSK